jgi:myosin-5
MAPQEPEALDSKGTNVWVPHDDEVWTRGTVVSASGKKVKVQTSRGEIIEASVKDLQLCHGSAGQDAKLDDLTMLPDLHSPALLSAVAERYTRDKIYTFTGPILLAVNPFKPLKGLYSAKEMTRYMKSVPSDETKLPPHAYSIADAAFKSMADSKGENQSILVSGESGAGKTESTKVCDGRAVIDWLTVLTYIYFLHVGDDN